ncbi:MAG: trypsin-like peptidase domain-containing protein [Bacillota bacterium]
MGYFSAHEYGGSRRPGFFFIIVLCLLSAFVGGLLVLYFAPYFFPMLEGQINDQGRWDYPDLPVVPFKVEDSPVIAIAENVGPAVVGITNLRGHDFFNNPITSEGSGVIFDKNKGYIVTNFHVVEGATKIQVTVTEDTHYEATLIGYDRNTDLAVLQIQADNLPEARFGDSDQLRVGEMAVAIGNPLGKNFARSVTVGVISALDREIKVRASGGEEITLRVLQTDAAINPGNSGGALVNAKGEVIGINSVKIARADVEGMNFAIPSNSVKPIIDQLIEKGYVSRPFIGIFDFREITSRMSEWYNLPEGIYVGGVVAGGPAASAGMRPGDVIVQMDEQIILTFDDLQDVLKNKKVGDEVIIVVVRDNNRIELKVKLGEMPRR